MLSGDETRDVESLTLDTVKSGIRFQKSVAEAWIKVLILIYFISEHSGQGVDQSIQSYSFFD